MTSQAMPICYGCMHLRSTDPMACHAFPTGIPRPILDNEADHRELYFGDRGIRFKPKTIDDEAYATRLFDMDEDDMRNLGAT